MHWDPSDQDIENKYVEMDSLLITVSQKKRQLGIFRDALFKLKMIEKRTSNTDGSVDVTYVMPKNMAGNDMEESQRVKLKEELIANIETYKHEIYVEPEVEE